MATVAIVGAGLMGTAVSFPLCDNGHAVRLVGTHLDGEIITSCRKRRWHPGLKREIPAIVRPYFVDEMAEALDGAEVIVSGVNSDGVHWIGQALGPHVQIGQVIIAVTKGLQVAENGDLIIFPDALAMYDELMQPDKMVFLRGGVDFRREDPSIRVNEVYDLTRAEEELTHAVYVQFGENNLEAQELQKFKKLCNSYAGRCPVYVQTDTSKNLRVVLQINGGVRPCIDFCSKLTAMVGADNFQLLRPHDKLKTVSE